MSEQTPPQNIAIPITNPTKKMTITYVISLSVIAALSIIVHLMLDKIIHEHSDSATIVNISGQQRMLSQRISLFTIEYLSTGHADSKAEAVKALDKLNLNHNLLISRYIISDEIDKLYFAPPHNVDNQVKEYTRLIKQALNEKPAKIADLLPNADLSFFDMAKEPLLSSLDEVVHRYENESIQKIGELRLTQQIVSIIILLTVLIEALFIFRPMVNRVKSYADNLQKEANYDHLTGLINRRAFSILIDKALALSMRHKYKLAVLAIDIDYFKSINDAYGHDVGDKAIQHISDILKNSTRASDSVARYGGEEFIVLLPQTDQRQAFNLADKILKKIEASPLSLSSLIIEMTVSAGVSAYQIEDTHADDIIKRADDGLYQAKNTGRNKVCYGQI